MANVTMNVKVVNVVKTTAEWGQITDVITKGVLCVEDVGSGVYKAKIGDGVNTFADLKYLEGDELTSAKVIAALGYTPIDEAKKGVAEGVATLDTSGKIPVAQLPSYVSDVIEVADITSAPETGESSKIYVALDTGKVYRWGGTQYVEISTSDVVTASDNNGYIKVNGTDVKVYTPTQADWNEISEDSPAFIKNKPTIPTGVIVDDALSETSENPVQNKIVKSAIDKKVDAVVGKTLTSNDFTDELKTKLDGIAEGATAVTVDETLTADGVNPVQGKAIKTALDGKVDATDTLILNCTL